MYLDNLCIQQQHGDSLHYLYKWAENSKATAVCSWHALSRSGALLSNLPSDDVLFKAVFSIQEGGL